MVMRRQTRSRHSRDAGSRSAVDRRLPGPMAARGTWSGALSRTDAHRRGGAVRPAAGTRRRRLLRPASKGRTVATGPAGHAGKTSFCKPDEGPKTGTLIGQKIGGGRPLRSDRGETIAGIAVGATKGLRLSVGILRTRLKLWRLRYAAVSRREGRARAGPTASRFRRMRSTSSARRGAGAYVCGEETCFSKASQADADPSPSPGGETPGCPPPGFYGRPDRSSTTCWPWHRADRAGRFYFSLGRGSFTRE